MRPVRADRKDLLAQMDMKHWKDFVVQKGLLVLLMKKKGNTQSLVLKEPIYTKDDACFVPQMQHVLVGTGYLPVMPPMLKTMKEQLVCAHPLIMNVVGNVMPPAQERVNLVNGILKLVAVCAI